VQSRIEIRKARLSRRLHFRNFKWHSAGNFLPRSDFGVGGVKMQGIAFPQQEKTGDVIEVWVGELGVKN